MTCSRLLPSFALAAACAAPAVAFAQDAKVDAKEQAKADAGKPDPAKAKEEYGSLVTPGENTAPSRTEVVSADVAKVWVDETVVGSDAPLTLPLSDEAGHLATLQGLAAGKPVVLHFGYYRCPVVCPQILGNLARQAALAEGVVPGRDYAVVALSLDPKETQAEAAQTRAKVLSGVPADLAKDGWHFTTAPQATISTMAAACGYHYAYLARANQFVHPDMLVVLSPKGRITRLLPGAGLSAAQLREAVVAAKDGQVAKPAEAFSWGKCFDGSSIPNLRAKAIMMGGGVLMLLLMAGGFVLLRRAETRRKMAQT